MNYEEAIAFLEDRIRWGMRPGTERVAALVDVLGHPQASYPVIHVSGTNGKFSVATLITAILSRLGLTVGTYTSPHLESVRERIAVAETPVDEETFAATLSYLQPFVERVEAERGDVVTYFELLTIMAFEAFFDRPVHAAVVEAGLGGEYDATNVADATVAVVVGVSLDHVRQFGDDLRTAAWEKAGIAKAEATVVTGVEQDDLFAIIEARAGERGARNVVRLGRDVEMVERRPALRGQTLTVRGLYGEYQDVFLSLFGAHQATNAALAIAACEAFVGEAVNTPALEEAFAAVRTPGRIDAVGRHPLVLLDGGHNPDGGRAIAAALADLEERVPRPLVIVAGMLATKDHANFFRHFSGLAFRLYAIPIPHQEKSLAPAEIVKTAQEIGIPAEAAGSIEDAFVKIRQLSLNPAPRVLIAGSLYLAGEILKGNGTLPA